MGPDKYKRRANLTPEEIESMRRAEAAGTPRSKIAADHSVTPAAVTRRLGAVRPYRHLRRPEETPQPVVEIKNEVV
jgi:hypothetical protein